MLEVFVVDVLHRDLSVLRNLIIRLSVWEPERGWPRRGPWSRAVEQPLWPVVWLREVSLSSYFDMFVEAHD